MKAVVSWEEQSRLGKVKVADRGSGIEWPTPLSPKSGPQPSTCMYKVRDTGTRSGTGVHAQVVDVRHLRKH